ncbi:MAG: hypothetical protein UIG52_06895 [Bacteroidales bacterium]|nr:hypothetical protein [Bacteroidales bacterium]
MAENITTLIDIRNRQKKFVISAEDLLYLVHGSGTEREKVISVQELDEALPSYGKVSIDGGDTPKTLGSQFSRADGAVGSQFGDINFKRTETKDGVVLEAIIADKKVLPKHLDSTSIFGAAGFKVDGDKCSVRMLLDANKKPILTLTQQDADGKQYTTTLKPTLAESPQVKTQSLIASEAKVAGRSNIGILSITSSQSYFEATGNFDLTEKIKPATTKQGDIFFVVNKKTNNDVVYVKMVSDTTDGSEVWTPIQPNECGAFIVTDVSADSGPGAKNGFSRIGSNTATFPSIPT